MTFLNVDVSLHVELLSNTWRNSRGNKQKGDREIIQRQKVGNREKNQQKPPCNMPRPRARTKPLPSIAAQTNNKSAAPPIEDRRASRLPLERRTCERRAKVNRRRQIDPTTCERDYSLAEIEFMNAMEEYKRTSGRMFPTCSEVLEVLLKLGYEKRLAQDNPITPVVELAITPENTPPGCRILI